jgi:hypothetical protein
VLRRLLAALAPSLLIPLAFVAVLRSGDPAPLWRSARPHQGHDPRRCT